MPSSANMLAIRRLPRACTRLSQCRGNATLEQTAATASTAPPPPPSPKPATSTPQPAPSNAKAKASSVDASKAGEAAAEESKPLSGNWKTHRPRITLEHPRQYSRPIARGVLPVYDLALQYIEEDSKALTKELEELRKSLSAAETEGDAERQQALAERVRILEIQSQVNLPEVRWKAANGLGECMLYWAR